MVSERIAAEEVDTEILGEALTFRNGRKAQNRILKAALTERISTWHPTDLKKRGIPTRRLINMYEKWGNGGFGAILTGNVMVDPYNLESAGNVIISRENDSEELRSNLKLLASAMKSDGALALVQLGHAGRQTPITVNEQPLSASDVQLKEKRRFTGFGKPKPATEEDIKDVIDRFVFAAKISKEAGFDGVELHGAHGYLLSQFLSPTTNLRADKYGGDAANRARLILEIYDAIRSEIPADTGFVVGIKVNSVEFQERGLQVCDAKIVCRLLEEKGFDFVELSGGTIEKLAFAHQRDSTRAREAFFLEFTDQIRPVFKNTVVYVTGGFRTAAGMINAIKSGSTDGIGLGRPITAEPDLPKKLIKGLAHSASNSKLNQDDFAITNLASNSQMFRLGEKPAKDVKDLVEGVPDFSDPEEAQNYLKAAKEYGAEIQRVAEANQPIVGVLEYVPVKA